MNIFLLCYESTSDIRSSLLAWVASTFTIPLLAYSSQIFPELSVALFLVYAFRRIKASNPEIPGRTGAAFIGLLAGSLPWFHEKYIPLTLLLTAIFIIFNRRYINRLIYFFLPVSFSFILQGLYYYKLNGYPFPTPGAHQPLINPAGFYRGLIGLFIDPGAGIIPQSPVFLTVFAGALFMFKEKRRDFTLLLLLFISLYPLIGLYTSWFGGKCPPGRYIVPLIPLLSVTMAFAFKEMVNKGFGFFISLLILISAYIGLYGMTNPGEMFTYRHILERGFLYFSPRDYLPQFIEEKGHILAFKAVFTSTAVLLFTFFIFIYRASSREEVSLSIESYVRKIFLFISVAIAILLIYISLVDRIVGVEILPREAAFTNFWKRHFSQGWEKVKMNSKTVDRSYLNTIRLRYEAERYSYPPAAIVEDGEASSGKAALIKKGSTGYVVYGQYRELPAGIYRAFYRLKLSGKPRSTALPPLSRKGGIYTRGIQWSGVKVTATLLAT